MLQYCLQQFFFAILSQEFSKIKRWCYVSDNFDPNSLLAINIEAVNVACSLFLLTNNLQARYQYLMVFILLGFHSSGHDPRGVHKSTCPHH